MEYTFSGVPWYIGDESYDDVVIGLHVPKRFDKVLNINKCHINHDIFNDILQISKEITILENLDIKNANKLLEESASYSFLNNF